MKFRFGAAVLIASLVAIETAGRKCLNIGFRR
jgi:hypothetical protein